MTDRSSRELQVSALARIEGEGALRIVVSDGQVANVQLRIYEPPRFFEAFLRGRQHTEVSDITSRICGICPVAYQASAWQAIEAICGVEPAEPITALRRLLYCGEWVSSHALHIYMLHAPDSSATRTRSRSPVITGPSSSVGCGSRRRATPSWKPSAGGRSTRSTRASAASTALRWKPNCILWQKYCGRLWTMRWRRRRGWLVLISLTSNSTATCWP